MNADIVLIGKQITHNEILKQYILRHLKENINFTNTLNMIYDFYKIDILSLIKTQKSTYIYIYASPSNFNLISKVISSHLQCDIILKNNTLIPEASDIFAKDSYVVDLFGKKINIISTKQNKQLPEILLKCNIKQKIFNIFGFEKEQLKVILSSIASMHNINYTIQTVVDGWYKIYITSSFDDIDNFTKALKELLSNQIIQNKNIFEFLINKFDKKNKYITFAESCTGGLVSSYFTKYGGVSNIFELGIISYSNEIKHNILDVSKDTLFQKGAVSTEVVSQMIKGAIKQAQANYAIAISGIAGPDGGDENKPIGTVYIGVGNGTSSHIEKYNFSGDRIYIQEQSVLMAIKMLVLFAKDDLF